MLSGSRQWLIFLMQITNITKMYCQAEAIKIWNKVYVDVAGEAAAQILKMLSLIHCGVGFPW